jgi:hypothetical protein
VLAVQRPSLPRTLRRVGNAKQALGIQVVEDQMTARAMIEELSVSVK